MKFLASNYSCIQNLWLGGFCPQIPVLSVLCPRLNLLNPPRTKFLGTPLPYHIMLTISGIILRCGTIEFCKVSNYIHIDRLFPLLSVAVLIGYRCSKICWVKYGSHQRSALWANIKWNFLSNATAKVYLKVKSHSELSAVVSDFSVRVSTVTEKSLYIRRGVGVGVGVGGGNNVEWYVVTPECCNYSQLNVWRFMCVINKWDWLNTWAVFPYFP